MTVTYLDSMRQPQTVNLVWVVDLWGFPHRVAREDLDVAGKANLPLRCKDGRRFSQLECPGPSVTIHRENIWTAFPEDGRFRTAAEQYALANNVPMEVAGGYVTGMQDAQEHREPQERYWDLSGEQTADGKTDPEWKFGCGYRGGYRQYNRALADDWEDRRRAKREDRVIFKFATSMDRAKAQDECVPGSLVHQHVIFRWNGHDDPGDAKIDRKLAKELVSIFNRLGINATPAKGFRL